MSLEIENTKNELIGIFDENDNYVRAATRKEMRKDNLIHRASDIFVINHEGKFLVQTRAKTKEYCPGYLDLVVGGVSGDKEDINIGAEREVKEEIGIDVTKTKDKLKFLFKFFFEEPVSRCHEYCYVIHLTEDEAKQITFSDHEVDKVDWYTKEEIIKMIKEGKEKITGGSVVGFQKYIALLENQK